MLKYINENLQVGDYITIESKTEVYRGVITKLETASLSLSCEGNTVRLAEDDITGLQYFEDDDTCLFPLYLTKVYPYEKHPDSFFGLDYNQRLDFDFFYEVLSVSPTNNTNELGEDLLLPDWVEYDEILYAVEGVGLWGPFQTLSNPSSFLFLRKMLRFMHLRIATDWKPFICPRQSKISAVTRLAAAPAASCAICKVTRSTGN